MRTLFKFGTMIALAGSLAVATSSSSEARWGAGAAAATGFVAGAAVGAGVAASGGYYGPGYYGPYGGTYYAPGPYAYEPAAPAYGWRYRPYRRSGMSCATQGQYGKRIDYSAC